MRMHMTLPMPPGPLRACGPKTRFKPRASVSGSLVLVRCDVAGAGGGWPPAGLCE